MRRPGWFRPAFIGVLLALTLGISLAPSPSVADPQFPPLTGRIVDDANLLSAPARDRITGWLEQFEHDTGRQVIVATVPTLQGYAIADYGYRLGRFWGIGQKDKNTGAILLVAPNEREVRIEVGYGLEGELTDAISKTIIEQDILPSFRENNDEQGIVKGTAGLLTALGWKGAAAAVPPPQPVAQNSALGLLPALFFLVIIGFFIFRISRAYRVNGGRGVGMMALGMMAGSSMGGSGGGFGGGMGGGGGFSGGGGSFGGGGASGSW